MSASIQAGIEHAVCCNLSGVGIGGDSPQVFEREESFRGEVGPGIGVSNPALLIEDGAVTGDREIEIAGMGFGQSDQQIVTLVIVSGGIDLSVGAIGVCAAMVFARFLFAAVTLVSGWVDQSLLADKQVAGMAELKLTRDQLEQTQPEAPASTEPSVLERFSA